MVAADGQLGGERADARPAVEPAVRVEDEIQQVIHARLPPARFGYLGRSSRSASRND
jgi:hypothetical protein